MRGGDGGAPADRLRAVDVGVGDVWAVLAPVDLCRSVVKSGALSLEMLTLSMASLTRWVVIRPFFHRLLTRSAFVLPVERHAMLVARVERRNTGCVMKFLSLASDERIFMGSWVHESRMEGGRDQGIEDVGLFAICGVFMFMDAIIEVT